MRKLIAILAAGLLVAGAFLAGGALSPPEAAVAQEDETTTTEDGDFGTSTTPDRLDEVLDDLVEEGVITREQADAVGDAIRERAAFRFGFHRGFARGAHLAEIADVIGIETDALVEALRDGQTIAEIAGDNGVDPQTVIDAIVVHVTERIDEAEADGRLTAERAAELRTGAAEKAEALVNGEMPELGDFGRGFRRGPGGFGPFGGHRHFQDGTDDAGDATQATPSSLDA